MKNSWLALVVTLLSPFAHAGSFSGGGGGTVALCQGHDGTITKIQLLDLAFPILNGRRERTDLAGIGDEAAIDQYVSNEVGLARPYDGDYLARRTAWFSKSATFVNAIPKKPFDVNPSYVRTLEVLGFCKRGERFSTRLVALQSFEGRVITLDKTIWTHPLFRSFDRAALLFHEAWYSYIFDAAGISGPERPDYLKPANIYSEVADRFLTKP